MKKFKIDSANWIGILLLKINCVDTKMPCSIDWLRGRRRIAHTAEMINKFPISIRNQNRHRCRQKWAHHSAYTCVRVRMWEIESKWVLPDKHNRNSNSKLLQVNNLFPFIFQRFFFCLPLFSSALSSINNFWIESKQSLEISIVLHWWYATVHCTLNTLQGVDSILLKSEIIFHCFKIYDKNLLTIC